MDLKKASTMIFLMVIALLLFLNSFLLLENAFHKTQGAAVTVREAEGPFPAPEIKEEYETENWSEEFKKLQEQLATHKSAEEEHMRVLDKQRALIEELQQQIAKAHAKEQAPAAAVPSDDIIRSIQEEAKRLADQVAQLKQDRESDHEQIELLKKAGYRHEVMEGETREEDGGEGLGGEQAVQEKSFTDDWQLPTDPIVADVAKRDSVRSEVQWAWNCYVESCFGQDEVIAHTKKCKNWLGLGLTIVDAMDTLYLVDLKDEYTRGREWIENNLNFNVNKKVSVFETNIRVVGGLLSLHGLTEDDMYLAKAKDLVDRFLPAFHTDTNIPLGLINLRTGSASKVPWAGKNVAFLAEYGTLQLEFCYLSHHIRDPLYCRLAEACISFLEPKEGVFPGLYPTDVDTNTATFKNDHISFGAMGDSYYEYLLKMWIWTGKPKDSMYLRMYQQAIKSLQDKLVWRRGGYTYIAAWDKGKLKHTMDHLACFAPGMLALGVLHGASKPSLLNLASDIMQTCYRMYTESPSGISPDWVSFSGNGMQPPSKGGDASYHLRPEVVESIFILYRVTREAKYREMGWVILQALIKCCRLDSGGYQGLKSTETGQRDTHEMESFFLAETLKYLFLLFDVEETLPLTGADAYVFNTEAHPLPIKTDLPAPKADEAKKENRH